MKTMTLLLATLMIMGCGADPTPPADTPAKAGTGPDAVRFAECIRRHDVPDFPDPDAKGDFDYGVSVSAALWTKAVTACKALQPPGTLSSKRTPGERSDSLRFARCIRAHGVEDFPDPVDGEPVINTYRIPSANRPGGMTVLNAAIASCR